MSLHTLTRRSLASVLTYRRALAVLALAVPMAQCINGSPEGPAPNAPTSPTAPTTPTVTAVTVTGLSGSSNPGQSAQLTANATLSDGTSQTVTQQATWESANTGVVTISSTGMATFVALGETDVRATYRSVSGSARVRVTAAPVRRYPLTGVLTDADNRRGVENVRVEVVDGADAGRATTTNVDGAFTLSDLAEGTFSVRITHQYYEAVVRPVTLTGPARLEVALRPVVNVSALYGRFNVSLRVTQQNCEEPVVPATSGQLTLSGNPDGTSFRAVLAERVNTRVYSGTMRADGSFSGSGGGLIAGFTGGVVINPHEYVGGIQGRVVGNSISGTESINYTIPCPGRTAEIAFSGSK